MLQRHGKQACVFSYFFVMSFRRSSQACPSLLCSSHSFCLSMSCPSPVLCVLHACFSIYPSFAFLFCNLFIICAFSLASLLSLLLACLLACLPACFLACSMLSVPLFHSVSLSGCSIVVLPFSLSISLIGCLSLSFSVPLLWLALFCFLCLLAVFVHCVGVLLFSPYSSVYSQHCE